MAHLYGVHHTGVTVSDIARSIEFYSEILGLELITTQAADGGYVAEIVGYPGAKLKKAYLRVPGAEHILELFQYLEPPGQPLDVQSKNTGAAHVCFLVDDLRAFHGDLNTEGKAACVTTPVYIDTGPSEGGWALYLRDPDGVRVELFEPGPKTVADLSAGGETA